MASALVRHPTRAMFRGATNTMARFGNNNKLQLEARRSLTHSSSTRNYVQTATRPVSAYAAYDSQVYGEMASHSLNNDKISNDHEMATSIGQQHPKIDMSFNDTQLAFHSKTLSQLIRSYLVFLTCSSNLIVSHNERLMRLSRNILGARAFKALMRYTYYGQFVAGEDEHEIKPIIDHLHSFGVKTILDYSAEEDVTNEGDCTSAEGAGEQQQVACDRRTETRKYASLARTYFYKGESHCERNMETFLGSLDAVAHSTNHTGFAAIKLTALGRPQLLMKLSRCVEATRQARPQHDQTCIEDALRTPGVDALSEDEAEMLHNMMRRVNKIAYHAQQLNARCMIDAEQTYLQPAINLITLQLMQRYNTRAAIVFNTYQCYLRNAFASVCRDLDLAKRYGFYFGAKLVRGAYMDQERARAAKLNYPDPINETYEATSAQYERTLAYLMHEIVAAGANSNDPQRRLISIMVASHNEQAIRFAVAQMRALNIRPEHRVVCFGQLYGMCDHVSFTLGQSGYSVYKYLPYGPVEEVLPYLSRRAAENHGILAKLQRERSLHLTEIANRIKQFKFFYKPVGQRTI
ncbi:Proline dehydrogenase 1, mitochondrial, partial [Fragariocoptes setiger]